MLLANYLDRAGDFGRAGRAGVGPERQPLALPDGERRSYAKRLRFRFIAVAGTVGRSGRRLVLRLSAGYPLFNDFVRALERIRTLARAPA